jgi:hypothetical protein
MIRFGRAVAVAGGVGSLLLAGATAASASTARPQPSRGCDSGVWSGYEGTQVDGSNLAVSVEGGKVVALAHQTRGFFGQGGSQDCFFWFNPAGTTDNAKYAVLASPSTGVPTGQALTAMWAPSRRGGGSWSVGLASTEKGSTAQQWVFNGTGWTNAASGTELKTNGNRHALSLEPTSSAPAANNTFHASGF